jgi:hypothetical protein
LYFASAAASGSMCHAPPSYFAVVLPASSAPAAFWRFHLTVVVVSSTDFTSVTSYDLP